MSKDDPMYGDDSLDEVLREEHEESVNFIAAVVKALLGKKEEEE